MRSAHWIYSQGVSYYPSIPSNYTTGNWGYSPFESKGEYPQLPVWLIRKPSEVITSEILLIALPYDHREKTIPSWLCVCNSVIILFPETNYVGDKIFRWKHEIMLEKYLNVFEDVFEKSNTLWKYLNTNTFLYGKLKYIYFKKVFKYFQIQMHLTSYLLPRYSKPM